ncbi:MAG: hypothetical protein IKV29_03960 [Alistipes sp.]|nr:hypothetical protein [Alistipes sp.]
MMKKIVLTILAIVATIIVSEAQPLRLGGRLPDIDVDSSAGSELKLIDKAYACIIFMHSESQPTLEAIKNFTKLSGPWRETLAVILLTPEQDGFEQEVLLSFTTNDTIMAFDNNFSTFESFNVEHIPFGVIYETCTRRVQWFGSLSQLSTEDIQKIIKKEKASK